MFLSHRKLVTMTFENILVSTSNGVSTITINRPSKLNALNKATIDELHNALAELKSDEATRSIVLTGSGEKSFVAGADISEFSSFNVEQGKELSQEGHNRLFNYIENFPKPIIAAVNGFALGGGLELAMSAHIRLASDNAKLGLPEVGLGLIPGYGGTQRLALLAGKGKAFEMIFTGGMISAEEGLKWGIVNHVYPQAELLANATKLAEKIARQSRTALEAAILSVNACHTDGVNGFDAEVEAFGNCFGTQDFVEGTTAFMEKRKPNF
jgi:enoyl-CoA hydratase